MPHVTAARIACVGWLLFAATATFGAESSRSDEPGDPGGPEGAGGVGGFGGPGNDPDYGVVWYPSVSVLQTRLGIEVPLWSRADDVVTANFGVDQTQFSGEAQLPDSLRAFPSDLWRIRAGLQRVHQFSSGSSSVLMFDIESASDRPLHSFREMDFTLGGFYLKPAANHRDSWTLGALYSPLGWPGFPMPLVAYNWVPSASFQMSLGLPSSVHWQPTERLSLDASLNPGGGDALATYRWTDRFRAYGGYQQVQEQYFLAGRVKRDDTFFAIEQRFIVGVRRNVWNGALDLHAGYAFDRHFGEGEDAQDLRDRLNLDSSAFLGVGFTLGF